MKKGIKFPGQYPIDVISTVKNIEEINVLPIEIIYHGMKVFVEDISQEFMYVNNEWVPIVYEYNTEIDPESIEKYKLSYE